MSAKIERPIGQTNASVQEQRRSIPWLWEGVLIDLAQLVADILEGLVGDLLSLNLSAGLHTDDDPAATLVEKSTNGSGSFRALAGSGFEFLDLRLAGANQGIKVATDHEISLFLVPS